MERPQDGGLGGDPRSIAERVRALRLAPAAFLAATLKFSLGFLVQSKKRKKGKNLKLIHVVVAVRWGGWRSASGYGSCRSSCPTVKCHKIFFPFHPWLNRTAQGRQTDDWLLCVWFCWWPQQTNNADMLDLALDYIKDVQKQVKVYAHIQKALFSTEWFGLFFSFLKNYNCTYMA